MEKELFIREVRPCIFLMDEAHEATGYLVIGKEKACVIDTMNGYNDLYRAVRKLTDLPLVVVNTHGHPDHIFGNLYFEEEAFLPPADLPLAASFAEDPEFLAFAREKGRSMPPFRELLPGSRIDLGGRTLEAHAPEARCSCSKRTGSSLPGTASTITCGCSWTAACRCTHALSSLTASCS